MPREAAGRGAAKDVHAGAGAPVGCHLAANEYQASIFRSARAGCCHIPSPLVPQQPRASPAAQPAPQLLRGRGGQRGCSSRVRWRAGGCQQGGRCASLVRCYSRAGAVHLHIAHAAQEGVIVAAVDRGRGVAQHAAGAALLHGRRRWPRGGGDGALHGPAGATTGGFGVR